MAKRATVGHVLGTKTRLSSAWSFAKGILQLLKDEIPFAKDPSKGKLKTVFSEL